MSVIESVFKVKKPFVAYLTAGDGGMEKSLAVMRAYAESGVDIIEVGMPFSDPVADGPVIQAAAMRAIQVGTTLPDVLNLIHTFKQEYETPVILFGYMNPLLQMGDIKDFFIKAKSSGVDGCLTVDLPLEESDAYHQTCVAAGIDPIYLIAPSTPEARIKRIAERAHGMVYYACRKGVTGMRQGLPADLSERIALIRSVTDVPVVVGFGISSVETAAAIAAVADGFVVGSLLVQTADCCSDDALRAVIHSLVPM